MAAQPGAPRPDPLRRYAPLVGLVAVLLMAVLVLPSALTLPQANPTATVELAPVPPLEKALAPQLGNFNSLSLAGSSTLGSGNGPGSGPGGAGGPLPLPGLPNGQGATPPEFYNCVAGHQSADPLSPPCSAYKYQGDNGGATYQGVTGQMVKILIYYDGNPTVNTARGTDSPTPNTIINLDDPPQPSEIAQTFVNRAWEHYFDTTYQTYNRHVQFWIQYGSINPNAGAADANTRASDAAFAYQTVHPFATLNFSFLGGYSDIYDQYMAAHGVLTFGSTFGRSASFYQNYPGLEWGYDPPLEQDAETYARFVCIKLDHKSSTNAGPGLNGVPRKFAFMQDGDNESPNYVKEDQAVLADLKRDCGLVPTDTVSFPHDGYAVDNSQLPAYATTNMAKLQNDKITTVLWPVGYETKQTQAANQIGYTPEWITGDDPVQFGSNGAGFQQQNEWSHAFSVTSITYWPEEHSQICFEAYRTVDQQAADSDVENFACETYQDLRQLFIGIQVAGPHLTPKSVDQGFHAIPAVTSTNPQVPTCYYNPGDYTCVKDAVMEWWDPTGHDPSRSQPGCWRMMGNGARFAAGQFPAGNLNAQQSPGDICNGFSRTVGIDPNPPSP